jgi:hypothetical protein
VERSRYGCDRHKAEGAEGGEEALIDEIVSAASLLWGLIVLLALVKISRDIEAIKRRLGARDDE